MTISTSYDRYLSHFKETVTLKEFNCQPSTMGLCALRHDVDHDLDLALEMAHKEHQLGFKASYFILPSAHYWQADSRVLEKCLQLQDYGHEVGLHVNSMAEWVSGSTDDIKASLIQQLDFLRNGGIDLTGIAAHGDKLCYEHNLSNYWCFEELRPSDPYACENGRTAEGPYEVDMMPRLLYPADHIARRADGRLFDLWTINLQGLGIEYHAWHTKFDRYFSDSAGGWRRTPDPIESVRGEERWQVLIHPEHWRGPKKYYFFLSSARSGSKWLSEVLSAATPLYARHEHVLNQSFHRGETSRKATTDVWELEDNADEVSARLTEAWEEFESQSRDFAEVNVYLEGFVSQLKTTFPEATFVKLKRDPAMVVSSLMDRDWYDTPEDRRHPRLCDVDAKLIAQFERVCHYVAQVDKRLDKICAYRIDLDELTKSPTCLANELERLGIAYHPRLGKLIAGRVSNARKEKNFPEPADWDENHKRIMENILSSVKNSKKIALAKTADPDEKVFIIKGFKKWLYSYLGNDFSGFSLNKSSSSRVLAKFCNLKIIDDQAGWVVTPDNSEKNTYLALGGSSWEKTSMLPFKRSGGWKVRPGNYIKGSTAIEVSAITSLTIYAISYGQNGKQIHRRNLGVIDVKHPRLEFAFTPHPKAMAIDFIVYLPAKFKSEPFNIRSFLFEWISLLN